MEAASGVGRSEGVKSRLLDAMPGIYEQWFVEKRLLGFGLANAMFVLTFAPVAVIPVKTNDPCEIDHDLYIAIIYAKYQRKRNGLIK